MSGRDYERYDQSRHGRIEQYDSDREDPVDHYDPHDDEEEEVEAVPEPQPDAPEEGHGSSRMAHRERRDRHGRDRGEREERRHRHSFGSQFLRMMKDGIKEAIREVMGTSRPAQQTQELPQQRMDTRLPQPRTNVSSHDRMAALREFRRLNPPTFNGQGEPSVAELWLERVNHYLDTLGIEDGGQRVSLAILQLSDEALHWWKMKGDSIGESWKEFKKAFLKEYIPISAVNKLRRQFEEVTQGDKTVDQYFHEFNRLSSYGLHLIRDEVQKCRRFEEGLRAPIRDRVMTHMHTDFDTLIEAIRIAERGRELTLKETKGRRASGASNTQGGSHAKKRKSFSSESGFEVAKKQASVGSSSRGARRSTSDRPFICRLCDQPGHAVLQFPKFSQARASVSGPRYQQPRGGCPRPTGQGGVVCYECQQPGHIRRDCPRLAGGSQAASTGPVQTQQSQRFQQAPTGQNPRPQAPVFRGGGRGGGVGKGKMAALAIEDEAGTSGAYQDAPAGSSQLGG